MSQTVDIDFWYLICSIQDCELYGISFPIFENQAECGGCNAIYIKPE